ncbi:unnamed protein product [Phyllotreta striolata]|uniref:Uncharacterized protein n=1 Tax=Phyllotreta striolata TaxID=444603 RepID=A0A9N9TIQ7_PHYSR|nr:unnamed protein product [Phyllotreta striolata]
MYAAAGGASLASRQARQRQKQNKQKLQKNKATELAARQPQAKQFQNYTDPLVPRLSRVERGTLKPTPPQPHERRHSASNYHLKEPQHRARIRESPSISIPVAPPPPPPHSPHHHHHHHHHQQQQHLPLFPGGGGGGVSLQNQLPQILIPEDGMKPERRCSFVRQVEEMEKHQEQGLLDNCNHICNFDYKETPPWDNKFYSDFDRDAFGSLDYPFSEAALLIREKQRLRKKRVRQGRHDLPTHVATRDIGPFPQFPADYLCSQGRAAWQERERDRRCSLSEEARQHRIKQTEAHHRWMKRNRIHDSSFGVGSDDEDFFSVYHQSAAANALLYVGLGTTAIGSVIFFVGTGDKGFKTLELRLIGPTLIACGLLCCLVRVLLCAVPSTCFRNRKTARSKTASGAAANRSVSSKPPPDVEFVHVDPSKRGKKKVSIAPGAAPGPSTSAECAELLPRRDTSVSIPEIHFGEDDSVIELQTLDGEFDARSASSSDGADEATAGAAASKFARSREPEHWRRGGGGDAGDTETSLCVAFGRGVDCEGDKMRDVVSEKQTHSGIVLSAAQLER